MIFVVLSILVYEFYKLSFPIKKVMSFKTTNNYKNLYIVALILLIILAGFRSEHVGYDTYNYYKNIEIMSELNDFNSGFEYEVLYKFICFIAIKIFGDVNLSFMFMCIVCETIIIVCIHTAFKKMSPNIALSMFLFVTVDLYLRGYDQLRQCVAIAVLILGCKFMLDHNICGYISMNIFAFLFHKTAIIFIPIALLYWINKKNVYINYILIVLITVFYCLFNNEIAEFISYILKRDYANPIFKADNEFSTIGILELCCNTLIFMFFFVYMIYCRRKKIQLDNKYYIFLNMFFSSLAFFYISAICGSQLQYERMAYYFYWSLLIMVPLFLDTLTNKKLKNITTIGMMLCGMGYLIVSIIINANGCIPYNTICLRHHAV